MIPTFLAQTTDTTTTEQPSGQLHKMLFKLLRTEPVGIFRCPAATNSTVDTELSPQILRVLSRLNQLRSTPPEERGPQVEWPTERAFVDARNFAVRMPTPLRALPHISLADDGEVNFAWTREDLYLDLGFYGDDIFSFYGRNSHGEESFGDDVQVGRELPEDLKQLITG